MKPQIQGWMNAEGIIITATSETAYKAVFERLAVMVQTFGIQALDGVTIEAIGGTLTLNAKLVQVKRPLFD